MIGFVGLFLMAGAVSAVPARDIIPSRFAYSLRYESGPVSDGAFSSHAYLDQFDLREDRVIHSWEVPDDYNTVTVISPTQVALCMTRSSSEEKRVVGIFDIEKGVFIKEIQLLYPLPTAAWPYEGHLFVLTTHYQNMNRGTEENPDWRVYGHPAVEVYSRTDFHRETVFESDKVEDWQPYMGLSLDGNKVFVATQNLSYPLEIMYTGRILEIDLVRQSLREVMNFSSLCGASHGVAASDEGPLVLISGKTSGADGAPENDRSYFIDEKSGRAINSIKTVSQAFAVVAAPHYDKVFVCNAAWGEGSHQMAVIDTRKKKVVALIEIQGFRSMNYVGDGKLYVSISGGGHHPGILVIDVRTNKVIKKIPGEYAPISFHPIPWEEDEQKGKAN